MGGRMGVIWKMGDQRREKGDIKDGEVRKMEGPYGTCGKIEAGLCFFWIGGRRK